jgi:hypothetical protein
MFYDGYGLRRLLQTPHARPQVRTGVDEAGRSWVHWSSATEGGEVSGPA